MSQHRPQLPAGDETPEQPGSEDAKQWLLFAGSELQANTALPVAIFSDETQARRAFVNERLRSTAPGAWAQLAAVDRAGRRRIACWFGSNSALSGDRNVDEGAPRSGSLAEGPKTRERTKAVGVLAIVAAVVAGTWLIAPDGPASSRRTGTAAPSALPEASVGVPVGYEATRTTSDSFAPGESRRWYPADGLHQVIVLVGKLSVEDGGGRGVDYKAGTGYVAGWAPYTVSNRTERPVTVMVRLLRAATDQAAADFAGSGRD